MNRWRVGEDRGSKERTDVPLHFLCLLNTTDVGFIKAFLNQEYCIYCDKIQDQLLLQ
jgi:hypothetical protein